MSQPDKPWTWSPAFVVWVGAEREKLEVDDARLLLHDAADALSSHKKTLISIMAQSDAPLPARLDDKKVAEVIRNLTDLVAARIQHYVTEEEINEAAAQIAKMVEPTREDPDELIERDRLAWEQRQENEWIAPGEDEVGPHAVYMPGERGTCVLHGAYAGPACQRCEEELSPVPTAPAVDIYELRRPEAAGGYPVTRWVVPCGSGLKTLGPEVPLVGNLILYRNDVAVQEWDGWPPAHIKWLEPEKDDLRRRWEAGERVTQIDYSRGILQERRVHSPRPPGAHEPKPEPLLAKDIQIVPVSHPDMLAGEWPRGVRLIHRPTDLAAASWSEPNWELNYERALAMLATELG